MNQLAVFESKPGSQIVTPLFDNKKLELLKNTICKGSNDDEFELFLHACQRTGLDPFMRQIHAVKRWDSTLKRECMTIQTGIDGYRLIAERTGRYAPGREPTYQYDDKGNIVSATAYVKKQTADGTWHEVAATAFFSEYCQRTKEGKPTRFWLQLGHAMIAKCAEALALRKAFPGDLSGIYTKEEMQQADIEIPPITDINHIVDNNGMINTYPKPTVDQIVEVNNMVQNTTKINAEQWMELKSLINKCTPRAQEHVWNQIHQMQITSDEDYCKMDLDSFLKLRNACLGNIAKQTKAKNENNDSQAENKRMVAMA